MELQDLKNLFRFETMELLIDNAKQFALNTFVSIQAMEGTTTVYITSKQEKSSDVHLQNVEAAFATPHFENLWRDIQKTCYFAQVSHTEENRLEVNVIYGVYERMLPDKLEIAVTDKQTQNREGRKLHRIDDVRRQIKGDYVLRVQRDEYIVVAKHVHGTDDTFQIVNGQHAYTIKACTRRTLVNEQSLRDATNEEDNSRALEEMIWVINSAETPFRAGNGDYCFEVWKCSLKLTDETTAARQSTSSKAFVESGLEKYLAVWKRYIEIEHDQACKKKEAAGKLTYKESTFLKGTRYRLTITNPQMLENFLSVRDSFFGNDSPVDLDAEDDRGEDKKKESARLYATENHDTVEIEFEFPNTRPCSEGEICISDVQFEAQYNRRMEALERIESGQSAKPNLAELIGGDKVISSNLRQPKGKIAPFDERVMQCFNGKSPTDAQRNAVWIAMNTPDFAIIQGPPGTGKTTVINAIMHALAAKEKDPQLAYGRNLLTAYQRDATSHVAEKLRLFGLPVPVYRGDQTGRAGDANIQDTSMDQWIREKREEVLQKSPDIGSFGAVNRLTDRLHLLQINFQPDASPLGQTKSVLETMVSALKNCMREERENYDRSLEKIKAATSYDQALSLRLPLDFSPQLETINRLLRGVSGRLDEDAHRLDCFYAHRLPATDAAMSDNGKEASYHILRRFQRVQYTEKVRTVAEILANCYEEEPIPYSKIQTCKDRLLYFLNQSNWNLVDQPLNEQVSQLLDGLLNFVEKSNGTDEQRVLAEYYNAFDEGNDGFLREWLSDFMTTIAATHQRAVSNEVKKHKKEGMEYENVLVDEAARSCPPDLLIPLACARERIILVGDQNQLPQFLSSEVYNAITEYEGEEKDDLVKKTMFERLIQQVKKLEQLDHKTRFIMLDQQFRMPATLGNIISKHFYNNELKSPCGNDQKHTPGLAHIKGKHLVWLDVAAGGQKLTESKSYARQSEVTAIVRMLKVIIQDSTTAAKYTFAIITFYSGQRDRIQQAILQDDLLCTWKDAIRVGTVDAFQGLEADIVFLSLVRSLPAYDKKKNPYGFLTNANRQCVALSRAKRCLIIVGDARMVSGNRASAAKQAMPAIEEIYQLCRKEDVTDACIFTDGDFTDTTV